MNYSRSGTISESPVPSDTQESNMKTPKDFDPYPFQRRSQRQIKKQKVSEDTINPSPTTPNPTKNPTLKTNQKTESIVKPNIKTKSIYYNLNDGYHVGDLCWTWNDGSEILWPCVVINKRKLPIQKPVTKDTDTISDTDTVTDDELDCLNDTDLAINQPKDNNMKKTSFKPFEILPDDDKTESQPLSKKLNTRLNLYVSSRYEYIVRLLPIKDLSQVFASDTWPTDEELSKLKQFTNERIEKASELIQEKNQLFDKKLIDIENDVDVDMKEPPVVEPTVIVDSDMNVKLEDSKIISHESSGHSPQTKDKNSTLQENVTIHPSSSNVTLIDPQPAVEKKQIKPPSYKTPDPVILYKHDTYLCPYLFASEIVPTSDRLYNQALIQSIHIQSSWAVPKAAKEKLGTDECEVSKDWDFTQPPFKSPIHIGCPTVSYKPERSNTMLHFIEPKLRQSIKQGHGIIDLTNELLRQGISHWKQTDSRIKFFNIVKVDGPVNGAVKKLDFPSCQTFTFARVGSQILKIDDMVSIQSTKFNQKIFKISKITMEQNQLKFYGEYLDGVKDTIEPSQIKSRYNPIFEDTQKLGMAIPCVEQCQWNGDNIANEHRTVTI